MKQLKLRHKNSLEEFVADNINYTKINGVYGYLTVMLNHRIFFFYTDMEEICYNDVSKDYEFI